MCCAGVVEDILLVPVGISYDTIIERDFVRHELMVSQVGVAVCVHVHVHVQVCTCMCMGWLSYEDSSLTPLCLMYYITPASSYTLLFQMHSQ